LDAIKNIFSSKNSIMKLEGKKVVQK